jgi:hypothetical protein
MAVTSINLAALQKEAEKLGISLNRDEEDNSYWGQVLSTRMELGGYETASACLEDLKAVQQLDNQQDLFSYENDPDQDDWYKVTYSKDNEAFSAPALAEAYADALAHHTAQSTPKAAPAKKSRMRKPAENAIVQPPENGDDSPLPDPISPPAEPKPEGFRPAKPTDVQAQTTKNLIRSEETSVRTPDSVSPQQQIASALLALAHSITEIANNLGTEAAIPYGSAFEEPKDVAPKARNRRGAN